MISENSPRIAQAISTTWWLLLFRGIFLIALGGYALLTPGMTLITWCIVIGAFLILDGILAIIAGISGWTESRGWTIVRGIIAILVGAFAIWHPAVFGEIVGLTVILIIAALAILMGVMEIYVAIRERKAIEGEGWMMLSGLFSILFGVVLVLAPLLSLKLLIMVVGIYAIVFGCIEIYAAFQLRRLGMKLETRFAG
jgi:uncharacterized membrane protein HdeD (DUF308 family)